VTNGLPQMSKCKSKVTNFETQAYAACSPNLIITILLISSVSACTVYHPQMVDIPLINKKKELSIDGGISFDPAAYGTISYGLTDMIAFQCNGNFLSKERYSFLGAVGLYRSFDRQRVGELYAGGGYGYADISNDANAGRLFGNYHQYFIQANYGKRGKTEYGIGFRAGLIFSSLTDENYYDYSSATGPYVHHNDKNLVVEPSIFWRTGTRKIKFSVKLNGCWGHLVLHSKKLLSYTPLNIGLGFHYRPFAN
jgi:hypothetical protein